MKLIHWFLIVCALGILNAIACGSASNRGVEDRTDAGMTCPIASAETQCSAPFLRDTCEGGRSIIPAPIQIFARDQLLRCDAFRAAEYWRGIGFDVSVVDADVQPSVALYYAAETIGMGLYGYAHGVVDQTTCRHTGSGWIVLDPSLTDLSWGLLDDTIAHELGHVLGYPHDEHGLMAPGPSLMGCSI